MPANASPAYASVNPATGQTLQEYDLLDDAGVESALARTHSGFATWRATDVQQRAAVLTRTAELYLERIDELARTMSLEMGKPLREARGEIKLSSAIFTYYGQNGPGFLADERLDVPGGDSVVRREPVGALLGIMPWDYPHYQVARFAGPNLVLGNTILLKHASQCPESSAAIEQIFSDAGFPEGAYRNLYASTVQIADIIIPDPRVCGVSLTGSEAAGAAVAEVAGRNLKKVVLELGGSDPFILLSTDNLDEAVDAAVAARLDNSGQSCNAAKRFIVIDDLYDDFLTRFTAKLTGNVPADPMSADTTLGPLSSLGAAENLEAQLQRAEAQGATIASRGRRDGAYFTPTVLTGVNPENDAYREEFFGPVASVYRVANEAEALQLANDIPFGLGSYLFTTDATQALRVADLIEAGMVFVNGTGLDSPELPFGGVKRSGFGRELGRFGIAEFANKKLIRILK